MVPLLNLLAFYVFIRFAGRPRQSPWEILRSFVTNPFIWSCAVGLALNLLAPPLPKPIAGYIDIIGTGGAGGGPADRRRGARHPPPRPARACRMLLAAGLKLVLMPVMAVTLARFIGVERRRSRR